MLLCNNFKKTPKHCDNLISQYTNIYMKNTYYDVLTFIIIYLLKITLPIKLTQEIIFYYKLTELLYYSSKHWLIGGLRIFLCSSL